MGLCGVRPWTRTAQDYGRDLSYMMDSYTPMTSANTTPATTPGSTPPSGADAYHYMAANGGGPSPGLVSRERGGRLLVEALFFFWLWSIFFVLLVF